MCVCVCVCVCVVCVYQSFYQPQFLHIDPMDGNCYIFPAWDKS